MAQGRIRYRCFLPDLTEFTVPPCTGPNYQQSTSPRVAPSEVIARERLLAEREGFEPSVPLLGVHTISSRAPSTARSPLRATKTQPGIRCFSPLRRELAQDCRDPKRSALPCSRHPPKRLHPPSALHRASGERFLTCFVTSTRTYHRRFYGPSQNGRNLHASRPRIVHLFRSACDAMTCGRTLHLPSTYRGKN